MKIINNLYTGLKLRKYNNICIYNPIDFFYNEYMLIKEHKKFDWAINKAIEYDMIMVFINSLSDLENFLPLTISGLSKQGTYVVVFPNNTRNTTNNLQININDFLGKFNLIQFDEPNIFKNWNIIKFSHPITEPPKKIVRIIEVALPIPKFETFSYTYDRALNLIGKRVIVPFGYRTLTGVVVSEKYGESEYELKSIIDIVDEKAIFPNSMIKFINWMSSYYFAPEGEIFKAAVPPNTVSKIIRSLEFVHLPDDETYYTMKSTTPKQYRLLEFLSNTNQPLSISYLRTKAKLSTNSNIINPLIEKGYIRIIDKDISATKAKTQKILFVNKSLNTEEKISEAYDLLLKKASKQAFAFQKIYEQDKILNNPISLNDLKQSKEINSTTIDALIKKGIVQSKKVEITHNFKSNSDFSLSTKDESILELNAEQLNAVNKIEQNQSLETYHTFLLFGVTGSGKTLVYMHIIKKALQQNKSVILLVPEISLTPQLIDRFEMVFPGMIAQMHSKLSDSERFEHWNAIHNGEKSIVIGARSALFAPVKNLGLIIVDEEHDSSYKQMSPNPRYNGRDSAIMRARIENATCVLGSATPSLESMYNALNEKFTLLKLENRADNAQLPQVKIIDMLNAKRNALVDGSFSTELLNEIIKKIKSKEGIIILQNRRGYAPVTVCQSCGYVPQCKSCSVTLTFHKRINELHCHYCGYKELTYMKCPKCGGNLSELGTGTQKVEEELQHLLKSKGLDAVIKRIDLDTTSQKGSLRRELSAFASGKTDILIGTQILAKGLDFERCTLVGIINADLQLFFSDFRASERTFQLLTQVSGRAGRSKNSEGSVIIQTNNPEHYAIQTSAKSDYLEFYRKEIKERYNAHYPPYYRFCIIEFHSKDETILKSTAYNFYNNIPNYEGLITYQPIVPFLNKIKNEYRRLIIIKSNKDIDLSGSILRSAIKSAIEKTKINNYKIDTKIDIDSFSTL